MLARVRRGILGGTFDPPHIAHLFAGEAAYGDLGLDVVSFIPTGAPWQKAGSDVSAAVHRQRMTELAIEGVPYFEVDDREVRRDGWTYTADTLETFGPDEDITLILGSDAALGLPTWQRSSDVLARVHIAVLRRPGYDDSAVAAVLERTSHEFLDAPAVDVSATTIRRRVSSGRSVRFIVPDPVRVYIADHGLYR